LRNKKIMIRRRSRYPLLRRRKKVAVLLSKKMSKRKKTRTCSGLTQARSQKLLTSSLN
jgi:hypothetical protein